MAIPDHPGTKASADAAAVRIAMTVGEAGEKPGILREVIREAAVDTDTPIVNLGEYKGIINSDLTIGVDVTAATHLKANEGICSPGVKLHGSGFIVTRSQAQHLGLGKRPGLERYVRDYRNGRHLTSRSRDVMVIDLFGLDGEEVRRLFPEVYQHVLTTVKPERIANNRESYRTNWWVLALVGLCRYIATVETMQHRVFQFLDASILPDNRLIVVASNDPFHLEVLSSRVQTSWALACGGTLEDRPVYTKSRCFNPFPFPAADELQKTASPHRFRS